MNFNLMFQASMDEKSELRKTLSADENHVIGPKTLEQLLYDLMEKLI